MFIVTHSFPKIPCRTNQTTDPSTPSRLFCWPVPLAYFNAVGLSCSLEILQLLWYLPPLMSFSLSGHPSLASPVLSIACCSPLKEDSRPHLLVHVWPHLRLHAAKSKCVFAIVDFPLGSRPKYPATSWAHHIQQSTSRHELSWQTWLSSVVLVPH